MSIFLRPHGLTDQLLCPWDFSGKNTGMGCHFLLQGIFLTQGSNPSFLHLLQWQVDSLPLSHLGSSHIYTAAAAAKSLQSCLTLCDPVDGSPPGSRVPGILKARTLEWVAISFSNAWKWRVKVKSLSRVQLLATPWTAAYQAPPPMGFSGKSTGVRCHCLLRIYTLLYIKQIIKKDLCIAQGTLLSTL